MSKTLRLVMKTLRHTLLRPISIKRVIALKEAGIITRKEAREYIERHSRST